MNTGKTFPFHSCASVFIRGPLILACAVLCIAQQKPRDLKYEEDHPPTPAVSIPRGYALVVGIAKYKNLPAKSQLDFPE